ncbi:MAG: COX15/CtaA family protein, partial [Gemmatimonadaceae bacterium]
RAAYGAAVLAILAVALGGLTAKIPGASVACTTVPSCGRNPNSDTLAFVVQSVHRTAALLLVLHLLGMVMTIRKRRADEALVVVRATYVAFGMVLLQLVVASSMILLHMPPVLRSLHEATGVGIWLSCFSLAYLARRVDRAQSLGVPEPVPIQEPVAVREPLQRAPHTMAVIVARGADL